MLHIGKNSGRLLALLLAAVLALAACSSDSASDESAADSDAASSSVDDADTSAESITNPNTGEVSDVLVPQDGSVAVYEEHIRVLNDCDWVGLMAQYPDESEIHLSDGTVIAGRQAIGDLFAGFVLPPEEGGLCGLTFVEQHRFEASGSQNVWWEADADFLFAPYNGSDAYVSEGLYMDAMVTTFEGTDLRMLEAADSVTNPNTGEVSDALVLIVSEERGTVSVAQGGELRSDIAPSDVLRALREVYVV